MLLRKIKKIAVRILTSTFSARIIKFIYRNRIRSYGSLIDTSDFNISNKIAADIYWNIYEKAELKAVQSFVRPGYPIIELGSSIGVVSCALGKLKGSQDKLYCIEANPFLISTIRHNFEINGVKNYEIINKAIGPIDCPLINFSEATSTLNGKIDLDNASIQIPVLNLNCLIEAEAIDEFILIADVEGAETYLLFEQLAIFKKCKLLIIELHPTSYHGKNYSREMMDDYLQKSANMKKIHQYRHVYVYTSRDT